MRTVKASTELLERHGYLGKVLALRNYPYPSIEISNNAIITMTAEEAVKIGLISEENRLHGNFPDEIEIKAIQGTEFRA